MRASRTYELFVRAIKERKQIVCSYQGSVREVCPVLLGHTRGEEKALTFQFGGESRSGLPPGGEWRCLWLSGVSEPMLRDGPWRSGDRHGQSQACVEIVEYDVNPHSPYFQRRD